MLLARMAAMDENALICDFAEAYRIYNWRQLPARLAATLAAGLSPDSRIARRLSGMPAPLAQLLLANIADSCRLQLWQHSLAARNGAPPPPSLFELFFCRGSNTASSGGGFDSAEAFEAWRKKMLRRDADA